MTDRQASGAHPPKTLHLELPYEGDHCMPCVYMAEVVEEAVEKFGDRVRWEKIWLKKAQGAKRFIELCKTLGEAPPVPSILIDGRLVCDMIPPVEDLQEMIEDLLRDGSTP